MNVTPDLITELAPNQVFVYGANRAARHGRGAARQALVWGARHGTIGFCGQTYGICTKDERIKTLPLDAIKDHVFEFTYYAFQHPNLQFLVTPIGCGLANLTPAQIAPFFRGASVLPNVWLPKSFWDVLSGQDASLT